MSLRIPALRPAAFAALVTFATSTIMSSAGLAQTATVSERTINVTAAQEAAVAALEQCRKDGYRVTVTVVNRAGQVKTVIRDDGANPHTVENSFRKAYTSLSFRVPTGEISKRPNTTVGAASLLQLQNMTTAEGALPIRSQGEVIGAIGVSGAPGGDKDAACAQVGINKIAGGL